MSKAAGLEVLQKVNANVDRLRSLATCHGAPALNDYAFEIRFRKMLLNALALEEQRITVFYDSQAEQWKVRRLVMDDTLNIDLFQDLEPGFWIWAGKFMEAFDAVHLYEENKIRFVK